MLINSLFLLLMSIAVTTRRDKSILYNRISIIVLLLTSYIALDTLELKVFDNGIGLFGGLFHMTAITNIFQIFIFLLSAVILQLSGFNQRKL
jgi:NADH-ubiquinone oxidoreductase chain 2